MRWTTEETETFAAAVTAWGEPLQWLMVLEETAELAAKVAQMLRGRHVSDEAIAEEVADVLIMMGQATHMIGLKSGISGRRQVEVAYHEKLRRLQRRLEAAGRKDRQ